MERGHREDWQTPVDGRLAPTVVHVLRGVEAAGGDSVTVRGGEQSPRVPHLCEVSGGGRGRKQKGRGKVGEGSRGLDSEDGKHGSKQKHFQWGESP